MNTTHWQAGEKFLAEAGLNLLTVFDCAALPETVTASLQAENIPLDMYGRLVLLGHGGQQMWAQLQTFGMRTADPVDYYSLTITRQFIRQWLEDAQTLILYPDAPYQIPLTTLGELAGWSQPSPLGLGIHPEYGLWFAYRAVFLTQAELPITPVTAVPPSACTTCQHKPCITACPAHAVQTTGFDVFACAHFRVQPQAVCADRCLARLACPVAPEHHYTEAQLVYHYRQSLATIRRYQIDGAEEW